MKKTFFPVLVLLMSLFVACHPSAQKGHKNQVKTTIPEDWKKLDEPEFVIFYPDTFELQKPQVNVMGMKFILLSKSTSPQDNFRENINLVIQDLNGRSLSLDMYKKEIENNLSKIITDGHLLKVEKVKNGDTEFLRVIYTGKQGQYDLKWEQFIWIKDRKMYILTLTTAINQFDHYAPVAEKIMKTFQIK